MNYAALVVPDFSLHAVRRSDASLAGRPLGIVAGEGRTAIVRSVSPEATGVEPGLAVTLAMARCPALVLRPRDPAAETEAGCMVIAAALTLSPRVEHTGAGWCTVDLQGADEARTLVTLRLRLGELAAVGIPVRAGIAGTPLLAALAARSTETVCVVRAAAEFLRPLPLAWAEPTAAHAEILAGWGVRTLGDLTALPKGEVGQRLGPAGAALWERAAGETTRPLKLVEPKKSFAAAWAYDPPVESLEPLLFLLRRYAERVALELRAAGFVAEKLALTLLLEDETDHRREFRLPEPGADVDGWQRILHAHLETLKTAARVIGVRLVATPARPPEKQDGLFETGLRDPAVFWESLARVGALVGDDRVGTPVVAATHRADAFVLTKPAEAVPEPESAPVHAARGLVLRRFRPAWRVRVHCDGARPVEIVGGQLGGDVCAASGPWRSEGEWWTAAAWAVELWQVELAAGGLYQLARTADGWCVEGVFD